VSVVFEGLTVDDAFRRLLRDYHAVYLYAATGSALQSVTVYGPVVAARSGLTGPPSRPDEGEPARGAVDRRERVARDAALEILARSTQAESIENALEVLDGLDSVPAEPLLAFAGAQRPATLRARALRILVHHWPEDPRVVALIRAGTQDADPEIRELAAALLETLRD
jgi:hypothetical protein